MFEEIGENIKKYCPAAWVINHTNPMTLCIKTLYRVFSEIKAYGCCHEVFGTQKLLRCVVKEHLGIEEDFARQDIKVDPISVNHFTWITEAKYRNLDLFPLCKEFCEKHSVGFNKEGGFDNN